MHRIRASEIAALAGMNPHEPQEVAVEKFRKRVDPENFKREIRERGEEPEWMTAQRLRYDPRFQCIVEKAAKPSSNTAELNSKKESFQLDVKNCDATEKHKRLIQQEIDRTANTTFGVRHEDKVREKWSEETGKVVQKNGKIHKKELFQIGSNRFILSGKVDGIVLEETNAVLEIKNRTLNLFKEVAEYEMVQVQAYCFLLDYEKCYLVEALKTDKGIETDWQEINRDPELWRKVVEEVQKVLAKHFG